MTPNLPLILVTRGRLDLLAGTLGSLFAQLTSRQLPFVPRIVHVWQDDSSPYEQSYGLHQLRAAFGVCGISFRDFQHVGSVASSRARAITSEMQHSNFSYVAMFDGDVLFMGRPIEQAFRRLKAQPHPGAVGWTHMDLSNERGFADFSHDVFADPEHHLHRYAGVAWADTHSAFHFYEKTSRIDHVSTQAVWNVDALLACGVLDLWASWSAGVRSYDVTGSSALRKAGHDVEILSCRLGYTWNTYLKSDAHENYWLADAASPGKVI